MSMRRPILPVAGSLVPVSTCLAADAAINAGILARAVAIMDDGFRRSR
jgi:hypothetical protein